MKKSFYKFLLAVLIGALSFPFMPNVQVAYAGKTGTWSGSTTHQFFPTIIQALLGNAYSLVPSQAFYGDGSDGALTMGASGTTTLTRDMFWTSLSWPAASTATISVQNQRIFVNGNCDFTNAPTGAIDDSGGIAGAAATNGGNGGAAGGNGNSVPVGTNLASRAGGAGGAGGTTTGTQGAANTGGNGISCVSATTGTGGGGGAGGTGTSGAGGAARAVVACTAAPMRDITTWFVPSNGSGTSYFVTGGGPGGSGGGGDTTNSGAGGGGGGASGATIYLSCKTITTGAGSVSGTIRANGGAGANGGSPTVGNTGGGGAGGGGAGGWIVVKYNAKVGNSVSNLITATAGANGTAGTGHGTGTNGTVSATTAQPGLIQLLNLSTGAITSSTTGNTSL